MSKNKVKLQFCSAGPVFIYCCEVFVHFFVLIVEFVDTLSLLPFMIFQKNWEKNPNVSDGTQKKSVRNNYVLLTFV
jgi:hypothetical protein